MRQLWNNRDLRQELLLDATLTGILLLLSLATSLFPPLAAAGAGLAFSLLHVILAARRYRAMSDLSLRIDRVLHGNNRVLIANQEEGELSVLISEIQKMVLRLQEQADLLQDEKQTLTRAIQDIFHQVRTPLTALNIQVSLLTEESLTPEHRLRIAREMRRQLQRLDWLMEALLKISRIDAGTVEFRRDPVSVSKLIETAAAPLAVPMELREQKLETAVGEESFTGDLAWSAECLGNLLKNCMEHTPVGGTIRVTAEENALFTAITVTDTGPGFDPEDLPHLFDRFYRGRNAGADSVGIGLALARKIASEQNGALTAENAPEGGACFRLTFHKCVV